MFSTRPDFASRVPTIIETGHAGSRAGMELSLQATTYPLSVPIDGMAPANGLCDYSPFSDPFSTQQYPGEFNFIPYVQLPYAQYLDSQSPESLSASESPNNMPSLTSAYTHPDWNARKLSLPAESPIPPLDAMDEPTPTWSSAQMMGQQQSFFSHRNDSAPIMSLQNQPDFASSTQLDPLSDVFGRRGSSTSALAVSMSSVDIANQETAESSDSSQAQPSSLAERRQKVRPANLGLAAMRSASYSVGMPGSPGANHATASEQALRRIRSSGVGRISKPTASGQRSPLHLTFAENAASPKFARHVPNYSVSTISSGPLSATTNSLAPPTPSTPSDLARFPHWQSQLKIFPSECNMNSVSSQEEAYHHGLYLNVSSPPGTPLDADPFAQYRTHIQARQQVAYHETPPQSAPATQLTFAPTSMMPHSQAMAQSMSGSKSHLRRPSLPDNNIDFSAEAQQNWPPVPMFSTTEDFQMGHSMQSNQHDNPNMRCYPMSLAEPFKSGFSVHHYSPPHSVGCMSSPPRNDSLPKMYHFSNTGPEDFGSTAHKS